MLEYVSVDGRVTAAFFFFATVDSVELAGDALETGDTGVVREEFTLLCLFFSLEHPESPIAIPAKTKIAVIAMVDVTIVRATCAIPAPMVVAFALHELNFSMLIFTSAAIRSTGVVGTPLATDKAADSARVR